MNQAIIISTTPHRYDFLENCLKSFEKYDKYQIIIMSDYNYFEGKMKYVIDHTDIDEFTMIADSMEIKDLTIFNIIFEEYEGKSVSFFKTPHPYHMLFGKFRTEILKQLELDWHSKTFPESDVFEQTFGGFYEEIDPDIQYLLHPDTEWQTGKFIEKFERTNMVVENKYFIKYKGHWSAETLPPGHVLRT